MTFDVFEIDQRQGKISFSTILIKNRKEGEKAC